jgi:hypothetical protein
MTHEVEEEHTATSLRLGARLRLGCTGLRRPAGRHYRIGTTSLLDAELFAFRVCYDDMFGPRFLDLLENCGAEVPGAGRPRRRGGPDRGADQGTIGFGCLGLAHLLEQQPPAESDSGTLLNRIVWMLYGLERPKYGSVIHGHNRVMRDRASAQQPFDEHAVVLHHITERGGPAVGAVTVIGYLPVGLRSGRLSSRSSPESAGTRDSPNADDANWAGAAWIQERCPARMIAVISF